MTALGRIGYFRFMLLRHRHAFTTMSMNESIPAISVSPFNQLTATATAQRRFTSFSMLSSKMPQEKSGPVLLVPVPIHMKPTAAGAKRRSFLIKIFWHDSAYQNKKRQSTMNGFELQMNRNNDYKLNQTTVRPRPL
jgi:hypothetical protein